MRPVSIIVLVFTALVATQAATTAQTEPLRVVATTTIIADVAAQIGGDRVSVTALVPAGADAHSFEPSPTDAALIADADLLLVNGAGYEIFLTALLENVGAQVSTVVVSEGVPILSGSAHDDEQDHADEDHADATPDADHNAAHTLGVLGDGTLECGEHEEGKHAEGEHAEGEHAEGEHAEGEHAEGEHAEGEHAEGEHTHGVCDPHVWMNPQNVRVWAANIAAAYSAADPDGADVYSANLTAYVEQLTALDAEIAGLVESIPSERRVLVTNHAFLAYFAQRYGFEVVATILPQTTDAERTPQELAAVITLIEAEGVTAIFAETSANAELAEIVADETGAQMVGTLYSETLGTAGSGADTYIGMMRANAQTIVGALAG